MYLPFICTVFQIKSNRCITLSLKEENNTHCCFRAELLLNKIYLISSELMDKYQLYLYLCLYLDIYRYVSVNSMTAKAGKKMQAQLS